MVLGDFTGVGAAAEDCKFVDTGKDKGDGDFTEVFMRIGLSPGMGSDKSTVFFQISLLILILALGFSSFVQLFTTFLYTAGVEIMDLTLYIAGSDFAETKL